MREMTSREMDEFLGTSGVGVLALANGGDAYALPLFYARERDVFYFHSRPGEKDDFIDSTKEACFVVSRVDAADFWQSVHAFGKVERLAGEKAEKAVRILAKIPLPPEWAMEPEETPKRSRRNNFVWRLVTSRITGRKSQPSKNDPGVA